MYLQADAKSIPLATKSVDLIIADPPFGINFTGKPSNYNRKSSLVDDYIEVTKGYEKFVTSTMLELYRVLKDTGTLWIIMGYSNLRYWEYFGSLLFNEQIGHVIWKYQFGVYAKKRPVVSHYHLLVYAKGDTWTWNQQGYDEDVWVINRPYRRGEKKYPNRLPDQVVEQIIIRSSNEAQIIYDPFVGSGTTVKCANKLGRIGIGSDIKFNNDFWIAP
jgi:site-specific DNA-methyltransferase (adenine-specific)